MIANVIPIAECNLPGLLRDPPFRFQEIHLELTTACNFKCGFCPLPNLTRPAARLSYETAEAVLCQCVDEKLTRHATFHLMGEALLHPQCVEIIELCRDLGIRTRLVTNGSLYREDKYVQLFELLDKMDISYRTVDDLELHQVQKKLTFREYLDKVMAAIDLRASMPQSSTIVRLRVFISSKTIPSLRHLCERLNVDPDSIIAKGELEPYQAFSPFPWLTFLCEAQLDWINKGKKYPSHFGNCEEFETGFSVLAGGEVTTCCWDAHGGNVMGNVNEEPLKDILFSKKAEGFRASFRRHICPTETCQSCLGRPSLGKSVVYQTLSLINRR